ncbi:MAG TPA: ABC transporter permease [Candidatus Caccovivens faecavium]|nr:ABC transporter permease [Candidatus Caccovivens faecavium]
MHFSKALFKQSMKANWVKWLCVTVATCVMLAIVIIVLGSLAINDIRDSLKDVFTQADQESYLKENSVDSYEAYNLSIKFADTLESEGLEGYMGIAWGMITSSYQQKINEYTTANGQAPTGEALVSIKEETVDELVATIKSLGDYLPAEFQEMSDEELGQFIYIILMAYDDNPDLSATSPDFVETAKASIKDNFVEYAGITAYNLYISQGEEASVAEGYAAQAVELANTAINSYEQKSQEEGFVYDEEVFKEEANEYVINMIYTQTYNQFITSETPTEEEISNAEQYAVAAKVLANTAISTYELWIDELTGSEMTDAEIKAYAKEQASASITDQIPEKVAEALEELGNMDIYGLIIGSIFYRIAGLLLPMVFVIMVANGLLAGQVDSGSMAYVLSTPTKRRTVACTQMAYLMLSLLAMFILVTVTSVISIWVVGGNNFAINFAEICLFNLGAFLTMFAFAGYCFMCSAIFNRSKYSMSIGGGLSIFMLVCTILGLFGSNVVPSAMRIDAMNVFNYFSIISLFDTVSILNGTISFAWKFAILASIAIVTFIIGVFRFEKKDLPL